MRRFDAVFGHMSGNHKHLEITYYQGRLTDKAARVLLWNFASALMAAGAFVYSVRYRRR